MRNWEGDLAWYKTHETTAEIGFNPDGRCLQVCRTSRDIGALYPSAKAAQDATPKKYRVLKVRDFRKGMKIFIDDPNDSNPYGHIVTMIGRVKGFDWDDPNDVLVRTNSVVSGKVVVVRLSYFGQHWGDKVQFAAFWLNGKVLDYALSKADKKAEKAAETPTKDTAPRVENFRKSRPEWDVNILDRAVKGGRKDIAPKIKAIEDTVDALPSDLKDTRVKDFKETFEKTRILDMPTLNAAVKNGRSGRVKDGRDELHKIIKSVLRH